MTTAQRATDRAWWADPVDRVVADLDTDATDGLTSAEAADRLRHLGPNAIPKQPPPDAWSIVVGQIAQPMNIMLGVVTVLSFLIGQTSTALLVGALVLLNIWLATSQERKARASVEALEDLQVPSARVVRDAAMSETSALDLVPGDLVMVEAGDLVPADGRIVSSAALEVQEAALTGESAPVAKDGTALPDADVPLGDRTAMLFQNTSVTRGTATLVVTATGLATEMGKIASLLEGVTAKPSPLQSELNQLTNWLGILSWIAVAIIFLAGLARGLDPKTLILLCVLTAIAAIPAGLPTFVQLMLSIGAQRLADAKAVVKSLNDVETLGSTSAINSDKTGTLTLNQMTATEMFTGGHWYRIEGGGYDKQGAVLQPAGVQAPDFIPLAYGLTLCSDATVGDNGTVVGDPTEAALVVLAAKIGVDAEVSRRELPRVAEVPFDSTYKFMCTYHVVPDQPGDRLAAAVKGAPDVVMDRCASAYWRGEIVPITRVRSELEAANRELSERGLRVLSFALRWMPESDLDTVRADPMAAVSDLVFVALVGIIDPLRPTAKDAVRTALQAGIDVRMITGDHAITAKAIADDLGLGPGVITGTEFEQLSDDAVRSDLDQLHVFGRVAPEDKLRLVSLMQDTGQIVAMTGDAVNDAAALKQADIGVAMGSGSEVSKQAAKMILTDDRFATLVHAVELGRDIYDKIMSYIAYQLTNMLGLLSLMLLATVFNINSGVALTPGMIIFTSLFITALPVIAVLNDTADPDLMRRSPRDPSVPILNRQTAGRWITIGVLLGVASLVPLVWGPDEPSVDAPSIAMTMTFAVGALGIVGLGAVFRRDPGRSFEGPPMPFFAWTAVSPVLTWLAVELPLLQRWLDTVSLTGSQWLAVLGLALLAPVLAIFEKAYRRSRTPTAPA